MSKKLVCFCEMFDTFIDAYMVYENGKTEKIPDVSLNDVPLFVITCCQNDKDIKEVEFVGDTNFIEVIKAPLEKVLQEKNIQIKIGVRS